ncbi:Methionine synthase, partial [Zancudomyces culisetae]
NHCISDFISSTHTDYVGTMLLTSGKNILELADDYKDNKHDDYTSLLIKTLADRLVEAMAERVHLEIRQQYWGYEDSTKFATTANSNTNTNANTTVDVNALFACKYEGIRPAIGYPTQPDHSEITKLWKLATDAHPEIDQYLSFAGDQSYMLNPPNSISALVFANPRSKYFSSGKICKDQVEDYAARANLPVSTVEKNLQPILAYTP